MCTSLSYYGKDNLYTNYVSFLIYKEDIKTFPTRKLENAILQIEV